MLAGALAGPGVFLLRSGFDTLGVYGNDDDALCLVCGLAACVLGLTLLLATFRCTKRVYGWPGLLALAVLLATANMYL